MVGLMSLSKRDIDNSGETVCAHPRLALETTPDGYLTGAYVCDECGQSLRTQVPIKSDTDSPRQDAA
jgi:hypothetical protein